LLSLFIPPQTEFPIPMNRMILPPLGRSLLSFLLLFHLSSTTSPDLHLTTNAQGYLTVIQGFATQLQCILNSCSKNVNWYKDDALIFNSTSFVKESNLNEESFLLQHQVDFDHSKDCSGSCSDGDGSSCGEGNGCLDNSCCPCQREHFTLILKNLTFEDSGRYRCQVGNSSSTELLEFQVEVLESGLRGGFHQNISFDHSECCEKKGISPLCRAMCKPSEMDKFHFDPTSCKTEDYKNFLSCATEGGNRSHVHCCKTQLVLLSAMIYAVMNSLCFVGLIDCVSTTFQRYSTVTTVPTFHSLILLKKLSSMQSRVINYRCVGNLRKCRHRIEISQ
ncbi:hypothetical protein PENTCL1PPCAC_18001, partial [Pristionchus entomophagus]